jgi:hypothetical protein
LISIAGRRRAGGSAAWSSLCGKLHGNYYTPAVSMTASRDLASRDLVGGVTPDMLPFTITPTAEELAAGTLSEATLARACAGLRDEGVIVIKQVVDLEHVRALRERVLADIAAYETNTETEKIEMGGQGWWHNWQGGRPPPFPPFLFDDICFNEYVIAVTMAMNAGVEGLKGLSGGYGLIVRQPPAGTPGGLTSVQPDRLRLHDS